MEPGIKHFRKRDAILECLRQTKCHPGAEELYRQVHENHPDISLATVYRNLDLFRKQGLIMSVGTVNGVERFDGNTEPHVHFICTGCGCVEDLPSVALPSELADGAAHELGGRIDGIQLTFTGLCRECATEN